jgi:hypothetical protein
MTRIARCCCGALRAEVAGEPPRVGLCHCMECQRRTGSAFGVVAFFPKEKVRIDGTSKVYVRRSDAGRKVEFHFWRVRRPVDDALAGDIGVGDDAAFVDDVRSPDRTVY